MLRFPRTLLTMFLMSAALPALAQAGDAPLSDGALIAEVPAAPDTSAIEEMFPDGMPELFSPQSYARNYVVPPHLKPSDKLPTRIEYSDGGMNFNVGTKVTGNRPAVLPPASSASLFNPNSIGAAGGSGELTGQFRYTPDKDLELYGARRLGVVQSDGAAPALNESTTVGARYQLPRWMTGGKIGASVELSPVDSKARVEYRRPIGPAEGFIAAEQVQPSVQSDHRLPASVRAGVNRKF
jgi:hypothetical protein